MDGIELANSGDHPALNFLNTRCKPRGSQIELISSGEDLVDWLAGADLLDEAERSTVLNTFSIAELDDAAAQAREVREWLRAEVASWADADGPATIAAPTAERINRLLAVDEQYLQLRGAPDGDGLELQTCRHWQDARQLLMPLVASVAGLMASGNRHLVRVCAAPRCTIWFYDRTRSHRRRWCSMAVCGNRDKVKNHRMRAHTAD